MSVWKAPLLSSIVSCVTSVKLIFTIGRSGMGAKRPVKSNAFITVELTAPSNVTSLFAEVKGIWFYQVVSADYLKVLLS